MSLAGYIVHGIARVGHDLAPKSTTKTNCTPIKIKLYTNKKNFKAEKKKKPKQT